MMKEKSIVSPKGYLEIWKLYSDGTEELHFADHNVIVSGMGVGLALLFSETGSDSVLDFQIVWAQIGKGTQLEDVSTTNLNNSLSIAEYGSDSNVITDTHDQIINGAIVGTQDFLSIPFFRINKVGTNSVRFNIVLNKNVGNIVDPLKEIGLFMHNPLGLTPPASILVAYRTFSSIVKTSDFSLLFKYTLTF